MAESLFNKVYNPDVLSCLANLSNDEVFTPPEIVNQMLDMLPQELFQNPDTTFLDPACKTGVFLREIAKRLIKGLEPQFPDLQERIDHIFHKQLFGIAITELTSLLSRRGVYCSKYPNSEFSVSHFDTAEGNIRYKRIPHTWKDGRCLYCGASQKEYDRGEALESHAYEFIHTITPEKLFNMKFDVIIGNPPYQLNVGNISGNSSKAKAIYHNFISQAIKMQPSFLSMVIPSRWMTKSTEGISDEWVESFINCNHIYSLHDYIDSKDCFPGVSIEGGVCYFLWDKSYNGKCHYYLHANHDISHNYDFLNAHGAGIVIRDIKAISIIEKIAKIENDYLFNDDKNFSGLVSPKDFFTNKQKLTSSWSAYSLNKTHIHWIKYYLNKNIHKIPYAWISSNDVPKNQASISLHKVYIPAARGGNTEDDNLVLGYPFYGEPNSVCSQTYLVIGYDPKKHNFTEQHCKNIISYIHTKFFRYLVSIKKKTQNGPRMVYQFVPMQDFSKPWTDEELYQKYDLSQEEIDFIESMIKPMD